MYSRPSDVFGSTRYSAYAATPLSCETGSISGSFLMKPLTWTSYFGWTYETDAPYVSAYSGVPPYSRL